MTSALAPVDKSLRETLLELVAIPSPIGEEEALCNVVEARLRRLLGEDPVHRFQHSLVVHAADRPGHPKVGLIGHLDTVRTDHDGPPRIEGNKLYGAGASDMKSGLAVMLEIIERVDLSTLPFDLTLVFYEREEGPFDENVLGPILDHFDRLHELDFAICLEPSDNKMQLGCVGSVHATVRFHGKTAHSARPWQGDNAIFKSIEFLQRLEAYEPRDVEIDGYTYREVLSPTRASCGQRGKNVVPDRFDVNVNYRFAPGRSPQAAVDDIEALVGDQAEVIPTDLSPAGRPHATHPLVKRLADSGVAKVEVKQAWTDVARFDAIGVAAVNFGPGTQAQAHQKNEFTELDKLYDGYAIVERFLTDGR